MDKKVEENVSVIGNDTSNKTVIDEASVAEDYTVKEGASSTVKQMMTKSQKPTIDDYSVITKLVITEKSMMANENQHQITVRVCPCANKTQVKLAFERIFKVKVDHVSILNVCAKETTRGGRYKGKIQGYKKAVVTLKSGEAVDLFKE